MVKQHPCQKYSKTNDQLPQCHCLLKVHLPFGHLIVFTENLSTTTNCVSIFYTLISVISIQLG